MLLVAALEEVNANNRNAWAVEVRRSAEMVSVARIIDDGHGTNLVAAMPSGDVQAVLRCPRSEKWVEFAVA